MLSPKSVGKKITEARKKKNFTQAELARQVAISAQAVGKWERGESLPDIATLVRLAEILEVDLNYFSERFIQALPVEAGSAKTLSHEPAIMAEGNTMQTKRNMSELHLSDSDFSGLNNLHDKFSSSNLEKCLFIGSEIRGITISGNNIDKCDFSGSDLSLSKIMHSNLGWNKFKGSKLVSVEITKCNIENCDFTEVDFSGANFKSSNFMKNKLNGAIWKNTTFLHIQFQEVVFEGEMYSVHFENCSFYQVKFVNAVLSESFFKHNRKFNRVQFIDCMADKLTYAFLKSNQANMQGITLHETIR